MENKQEQIPMISVVMSVYNGEKYIREAIESILNQTFSDFELIILDDGCTDHTEEIIKEYTDKRIRYTKNPGNLGLAGSLNRGLELARGKYIARMDSDDVALTDRLQKQVDYMENHPDVILLGGQSELLQNDIVMKNDFHAPVEDDEIRLMILYHNPFLHPTVMIRGDVVRKNALRYQNRYVDDYDLWIRMLPYGKMHNLEDTLLKYRVHDNNFSVVNKNTHIDDAEQSLREKYISSLGLSDSEKKTLIGAFRNEIQLKDNIDDLADILLKYSESVGADPEKKSNAYHLTKMLFGFVIKNTREGLGLYSKWKKQKDCFTGISDKEKNRLFLKCLFKDRLHKPGYRG